MHFKANDVNQWFYVVLYQIADFTIQPNRNDSFYYLAEYE